MPDFLTRRNGTWHFVRRVPCEFASFDNRRIIKHSTRIKIANDRAGRRAARVAEQLNRQLEIFWKGLSDGKPQDQLDSYENARRRARALGFEYVENDNLLKQPADERLDRLEALVANGLINDPGARAALLGTEKRPAFKLSRLFDEYEELTKDEVRDLSPNQLRVFTNGRKRALDDLSKWSATSSSPTLPTMTRSISVSGGVTGFAPTRSIPRLRTKALVSLAAC